MQKSICRSSLAVVWLLAGGEGIERLSLERFKAQLIIYLQVAMKFTDSESVSVFSPRYRISQ